MLRLPIAKHLDVGVGLMVALTLAAWVPQANASTVVAALQTSNTVTGGTKDSTYSPNAAGSAAQGGFSVFGDFSVIATGGSDVIITVDTTLLFSSLPAGNYQTSASIDGVFSSSLAGLSAAYVKQFENDTTVLDSSPNTVANSLSIAGGIFGSTFAQLTGTDHITGVGTSSVFALAAGNYKLHQFTTIDISGVANGETIFINLPNGSDLITPVPSSITMLGIASLMFAGTVSWRRRRSSAKPHVQISAA